MALYENKITLKGFLGKDAENFATRNQKTFVILSLSTKSGYKDQQKKEWVNHTAWHRVARGRVVPRAIRAHTNKATITCPSTPTPSL